MPMFRWRRAASNGRCLRSMALCAPYNASERCHYCDDSIANCKVTILCENVNVRLIAVANQEKTRPPSVRHVTIGVTPTASFFHLDSHMTVQWSGGVRKQKSKQAPQGLYSSEHRKADFFDRVTALTINRPLRTQKMLRKDSARTFNGKGFGDDGAEIIRLSSSSSCPCTKTE